MSVIKSHFQVQAQIHIGWISIVLLAICIPMVYFLGPLGGVLPLGVIVANGLASYLVWRSPAERNDRMLAQRVQDLEVRLNQIESKRRS